MAINGVPRNKRPEPLVNDMIVQMARVFIAEAAYAGEVCVQPRWIGAQDFIRIGMELANEFKCRIPDSHIDPPTGVAALRFNLGYPLGMRIGSPEAKDWLGANPDALAINHAWHNTFYGLHIVD